MKGAAAGVPIRPAFQFVDRLNCAADEQRKLAMQPIVRITTGCGLVLTIAFLFSIAQCEPAHAQGGIICEYGSQKYRACCRESFGKHPDAGVGAREREIDACMNKPAPPKKK